MDEGPLAGLRGTDQPGVGEIVHRISELLRCSYDGNDWVLDVQNRKEIRDSINLLTREGKFFAVCGNCNATKSPGLPKT